jgi:two-component system cell cycle sensor histidine kinase/response regulator CckA
VRGNATQIYQVLLNLCVNARDAMPDGGHLTLRAENVMLDEQYASRHPEARPGPFVRIAVSDTGTGIPESVRDRIFDPFFSTKEPDAGTGLGLTTVLGIVKEHSGFINFVSHSGKGTTFEIHLPATPDAEALVETEQAMVVAPPGQGELVLVVDDEKAIRNTTERTLRQHHYQVLLANDGVDAIAQFTSHQDAVKAVVTDLFMPLMDGTALCRTLRRMSPTLPIIVSTGAEIGPGPKEHLSQLAELGVKTVMHKPHSGEELLKALFHVLHEAETPAGPLHELGLEHNRASDPGEPDGGPRG